MSWQLLGFQKEHPGFSWGLQVGEMSGKDKVHEGLTLHTALKVGQLCALPPLTGILSCWVGQLVHA